MGRTLVINAPCQICGDRSFGRHYGIVCCDGCSCFFKRSIRRNIQYACISGEDNCPVDKTRRNWCPSCRLKKCIAMHMNKEAVQKERGPRRNRRPKEEPASENSTNLVLTSSNEELKSLESSLNSQNLYSMKTEKISSLKTAELFPFQKLRERSISQADMLLFNAISQSLKSSVIIFLSPTTKLEVMQQVWQHCVVIHTLKSTLFLDLLGHDLKALVETYTENSEPDLEEIRLLICISFCMLGQTIPQLNFATSLADSYRFWLNRHCSTYYSTDSQRFQKFNQFILKLMETKIDMINFKQNFTVDPKIMIKFLVSLTKE